MAARLIDGKSIAQEIRLELKNKIEEASRTKDRAPCLAVILVGDDPASHIYVGHKKKACQTVGIESKSFELDSTTSQEQLQSLISKLNNDVTIDGILLQLPLPKHLNSEKAIDCIHPSKDVDGLTPVNQGLLSWKRPCFHSCTPLGVMKLLERSDISIEGKQAAVVGRSILVGLPMATMLANAGATVTSLHSKSKNPQNICAQADILVVATGVHHLVDKSWVKPGATVIDVGMHRTSSGLSGDVNFEEVKQIAGAITPVPGGVGPMTIAMLLNNCFEAYLGSPSES